MLVEEVRYAMSTFHSVLHIFSERFVIVIEGQPIAKSYVVDRMLAEFAAAAVVLAMTISLSLDVNVDSSLYSDFTEHIHTIVASSFPSILPYFLKCVERHHKHFLWTGPALQIVSHSEQFDSITPLLTMGELLDLPGHPIYAARTTTEMPSSLPMVVSHIPTDYRHVPDDLRDFDIDPPRKRKR